MIASLKAHPNRLNKYDENGFTPLMAAAEDSSLLVVRYLLNHGARIALLDHTDLPEDERNTALGYAVTRGNLTVAEELLRRGAKIDSVISGITLTSDMSLPVPMLSAAARGNDIALIKWLAKHGANMDAVDSWDNPALFYADNPTVAKTLIACGAHLNPKHKGRTSLLDKALKSVSTDIGPQFCVPDDVVDVFLDAGAIDGEAMPIAAAHMSTGPLKKMLHLGWNPNKRNALGLTPLMVAASEWRPDGVRLLLSHKANVNLRTRQGETALSLARSSAGHREYESHVDLEAKDYPRANEQSRQEVIRLLKVAGATE